VSAPLRAVAREVLVHTGQHYDEALSQIFFDELELPRPEHHLHLGGGTNTEQTARMLAALGPLLAAERPALVLVYGDTNSTLAGALAAAQAGIGVAHVEAGMRSYDRTMPRSSTACSPTTRATAAVLVRGAGARSCAASGVRASRGRGRRDGRRRAAAGPRARRATESLERVGVAPAATCSRPRTGRATSTTRRGWRARGRCCARAAPVVLPLHPRTRARLDAAGLLGRLEARRRARPPLGYLDFTALLRTRARVLTDSGGVQKEAYLAGVPCVTLRATTEWTETGGRGLERARRLDAGAARAALERPAPAERPPLYGDGRAGARVAAALARRMEA
jgi:UDP-N-acetylglucosamine 2-epimerase (non-hydrolysing)/UDP-GlcNAc3NAcA epimerase